MHGHRNIKFNHLKLVFQLSTLNEKLRGGVDAYFLRHIKLLCIFIIVIIGVSLLVAQYCSGEQIEKNERGGARSTYGREERRIQFLGGEN